MRRGMMLLCVPVFAILLAGCVESMRTERVELHSDEISTTVETRVLVE